MAGARLDVTGGLWNFLAGGLIPYQEFGRLPTMRLLLDCKLQIADHQTGDATQP